MNDTARFETDKPTADVLNSGSCVRRWTIERQVRLLTGLLIILGIVLSVLNSPFWIYFSAIVALGMVVSAIGNTCALGKLISFLPWNRDREL